MVSATIIIYCIIAFYFLTVIVLVIGFNFHKIKFHLKYRFNRSKLVKCLFIMPNTVIKEEYLIMDDNKLVEFEKGNYVINRELGLFTEKYNLLTMAYIYGNPNPLNLKEIGKLNIPTVDSESLKLALKNKFVKDLLTESTRQLILLIMVGINIGLTAIVLLKIFGVFDKK